MKKKITAIMMAGAMAASVLAGCGQTGRGVSDVKLEGSCQDILQKVYDNAELDADLKEAMQYYQTTAIDPESEEYVLGTDDVDYTDSVYSAPMMSSVAYQCVVLRLEADEDVEEAKRDLLENAERSKWVCVEAESVVVENVGDVVLYVMADEATAEAVKTAFLSLQ